MSAKTDTCCGVQMLPDEDVFQAVHPHMLGMYKLYTIWIYFIFISIFFMTKREAIIGKITTMVPDFANNTVYLGAWALALIIPSFIIAISRISLRWIIWIFAAGGLGIYLKEFTDLGVRNSGYFINNIENITILIFGILGVMGTEWYRQSHSYIITNRRIVITAHGLWHSERSLTYSKINDLILDKSVIGSIFGFGTIIPLTASGIGSGSDMAGGGVGLSTSMFGVNLGVGAAGGHSQNVPKESITYTIFNIPAPDEIHSYILDKMTDK